MQVARHACTEKTFLTQVHKIIGSETKERSERERVACFGDNFEALAHTQFQTRGNDLH